MRLVLMACSIIIGVALFASPAHAANQAKVFPPQNCSPARPLMAWDGSGDTYCVAIPTCAAGQVLTSTGPGQLSCYTLPTSATKTVTNTITSPSHNATTSTTAYETTTTEVINTADACTASGAICALYDRNLGRLPDQAGAEYWQDRYNILSRQGLSERQIATRLDHEMSGNAEAQNYAASGQVYQNLGHLASGTPVSSSCSGNTSCGGTINSTAASANNTIGGWNSVENVIGSSYVASGIANNLDQAGVDYWTGQYQSAIARGRSPEEAAQDVSNAIAAASGR